MNFIKIKLYKYKKPLIIIMKSDSVTTNSNKLNPLQQSKDKDFKKCG
jgi:hypothetical protein